MSDLLTCLRGMGLPLTENAADEIDRLESDIDRLTRELAEAKARAGSAAASLPDGWVAVPVEPTQRMKDCGWSTYLNDDSVKMGNIYRAMLSARPEFPNKEPSDVE